MHWIIAKLPIFAALLMLGMVSFAAGRMLFVPKPTPSPPTPIANMLEPLGSKSEFQRMAAISALKGRGESVVPALIETLSDSDRREPAAQTLALIGKPAVFHLLYSIESPDVSVRQWSYHALGLIGPDAREAVPALTEVVASDSGDAVWAVKTLSLIGNPADVSVPATLRRMRSDHAQLQAVDRELSLKRGKQKSLTVADRNRLLLQRSQLRNFLTAAEMSLCSMGEATASSVTEILNDPKTPVTFRRYCVHLRYNDDRPSDTGIAMLLKLAQDADEETRTRAVCILGLNCWHREDVRNAIEHAKNDPSDMVQNAALFHQSRHEIWDRILAERHALE